VTLYSLDSDIVNAVLKKNDVVTNRLQNRLASNHEIVICPFVYYEVQRWLLVKDAQAQLEALRSFVAPLRWLEFNRNMWNEAAGTWASATRAGSPHADPDLLIACHARHFQAVIVTGNTKHFEVYQIEIENWLVATPP